MSQWKLTGPDTIEEYKISYQDIVGDSDFPSSLVVKTLLSVARGSGLVPGQGAQIPHASWPKPQNIKQKQYCNKFSVLSHFTHVQLF